MFAVKLIAVSVLALLIATPIIDVVVLPYWVKASCHIRKCSAPEVVKKPVAAKK